MRAVALPVFPEAALLEVLVEKPDALLAVDAVPVVAVLPVLLVTVLDVVPEAVEALRDVEPLASRVALREGVTLVTAIAFCSSRMSLAFTALPEAWMEDLTGMSAVRVVKDLSGCCAP